MLPGQPEAAMEDRMDTSHEVTFPVFGTISPTSFGSDFSEFSDVPAWLAKACDGYSSENIVKKLQQTKYDRVVKNVVRDGIQNILYNRYTPMILPSFQDDDIMELTLIAARLKTMGLNASAAAISGECGEVLDTKAVSKYYTNYSPGMRLLMPNMERKECKEFVREKIHYQKPPYDPDHDPIVVQRKIQQLRLHGMARLRKALMEMQREQRELQRVFKKKSSGSDSSSPSPRESRKIQRPTKLRFPTTSALRTDGKLDDFNIRMPVGDQTLSEVVDMSKIFKRSSVNDEILATKLDDSMSTDSDSDGHVSVNSSVFSSPNILPPNTIEEEAEMKGEAQSYESSNESESTSESHSSDEAGGEVVEESEKSESDRHSTSSVEEAQFEVVGVGSDSDDSISF